jgi:predicted RNA-binding Zn ribbon-like protein
VGDFFQAWRRREAEQQAAEWTEEQEEARRAVQELPDLLRDRVREAIETLLEGRDEEVGGALEDLDEALRPHPELRERFFSLRVVDDAVEFTGSGLAFVQAAARPDRNDEMQDLTPD